MVCVWLALLLNNNYWFHLRFSPGLPLRQLQVHSLVFPAHVSHVAFFVDMIIGTYLSCYASPYVA